MALLIVGCVWLLLFVFVIVVSCSESLAMSMYRRLKCQGDVPGVSHRRGVDGRANSQPTHTHLHILLSFIYAVHFVTVTVTLGQKDTHTHYQLTMDD